MKIKNYLQSSLFNHLSQRVSFLSSASEQANKKNIFLASNSGIYAIDSISMKQNQTPHVVLAPMWLDKVDSRHHKLEWGQTLLGLPSLQRHLFKDIFPNYPHDKHLTWGHVVALRDYQCSRLSELHHAGRIILHDFRAADIKKYEEGNFFQIISDNKNYHFLADNQQLFTIKIAQLGKIFNHLTLPRELPKLLEKNGFIRRPHTELYYIPATKMPKTVLAAGNGLSIAWIKKHFPDMNLFTIVDDLSQKVPEVPANKGTKYNEINYVLAKDLELFEGYTVARVYKENQQFDIDYSKYFYSAIGYESYSSLTSVVKKEQELTYEQSSLVAPKNIPKGSLTYRMLTYYSASNFYDDLEQCFEMQFYINNITPMVLQKKLYNKSIDLSPKFFDLLEEKLSNLDDPLPENLELILYKEIFETAQHSSTQELKIFEEVIKEMQSECVTRSELLKGSESSVEFKIK